MSPRGFTPAEMPWNWRFNVSLMFHISRLGKLGTGVIAPLKLRAFRDSRLNSMAGFAAHRAPRPGRNVKRVATTAVRRRIYFLGEPVAHPHLSMRMFGRGLADGINDKCYYTEIS